MRTWSSRKHLCTARMTTSASSSLKTRRPTPAKVVTNTMRFADFGVVPDHFPDGAHAPPCVHSP